MVEYVYRDTEAGELWLDLVFDREAEGTKRLGPFRSAADRDRACDYLMRIARENDAIEMPVVPQ